MTDEPNATDPNGSAVTDDSEQAEQAAEAAEQAEQVAEPAEQVAEQAAEQAEEAEWAEPTQEQLGDNVTVLREPPSTAADGDPYRSSQAGRTIYIVGTAHVSQHSVDEVARVIELVRPHTVCIELCEARYTALTDENRWKNLDIFKVIREGKTLFLLANLAIGAYQRRLGKQLGVKPGAEMLEAAKKAEEVGANVELVDRDIHITLKRTWGNLSFRQKAGLLTAVMGSLVARGKGEEISAEQIEQLKEKSQLSDMMKEFAEALPEVKGPLIDERDRYMMAGIEAAKGERIVAVVGAGHVEGMQTYFGEPIDRTVLDELPKKKKWVGLLKWIIPAAILAAFYFGWRKNEGRTLQQMVLAWTLPNSVAAAFLTTLAGGKLLSILTAFVASPITSLNPLLGAGMAVGLVEAWRRRPTVADAERINSDVQSWRGVYRNPFTRVLLVAVMANLGSALGAWIGLSWVLSYL